MADRPPHRGSSRGGPRGGRGGGGGGRGGAAAAAGGPSGGGNGDSKERPKKENILDLKKYLDKRITVKFNGGREATGVLKGYDALMNLVLDEVEELLRGIPHPTNPIQHGREDMKTVANQLVLARRRGQRDDTSARAGGGARHSPGGGEPRRRERGDSESLPPGR